MDTTPEPPDPSPPTGPAPGPPTFVALPPLEEDLPVVRPGRRRLPVVLAAAAVVAALIAGVVVAAVGIAGGDGGPGDEVASIDGGSREPESSGQSGSAADRTALEDAMLAYGECMREHGVDLPDPQTSAGAQDGPSFSSGGVEARGVDPSGEEFEAADEACRSILEDAGAVVGPPSAEERAQMQDQLVAVAECMRAKGHDMPDPQINPDGGATMAYRGSAANDPDYQEDFEACHEEAGVGPGTRAPGSGS